MNDSDRRRRINLYKKIIVIFIITLIVLPTILCIILFCKLSSLSKDLEDIKTSLKTSENINHEASVENETSKSEPSRVQTNINKPQTDTNNESETASEIDSETTIEETTTFSQPEIKPGQKIVYLTFDDGPGANTYALLDLLDQYGVKATFFINYHEGYDDAVREILKRGHSLGMHTYTHDYESVYSSMDGFISEIEELKIYISAVTGYTPSLFRFPGGSSNSHAVLPIQNYIKYLDDNKITYFDWNVSSGDGGNGLTREQIYDNVISGISNKDVSVVLMHDSVDKMSTFEALPAIIEKLQAMDAVILPITSSTEPVHHNVK